MVYSLSQFKNVLHGLGYSLESCKVNCEINCDDNGFDSYTQTAIRQFQLDHNLPVTGALDLITQEKARQLIRNLQHSLNLTVDAQLPVNEFYGSRTCKAVQRFQQQHGLPITGIAEVTVRRKLDEEAKRLLRDHLAFSSETFRFA